MLGQGDYRVLVVDDDSPDGTGAVADALAREHPGRVEVLHRRGRRGLGRSCVDAFRRVLAGDADLVCRMDADLSHAPSYLPALVSVGLDAHPDQRHVRRRQQMLPMEGGRMGYAYAYDAGTEMNDEMCSSIPNPPPGYAECEALVIAPTLLLSSYPRNRA